MWRRQDSNLGRLSRQIYSLLPLAARAHRRVCCPSNPLAAVFPGNDVNNTRSTGVLRHPVDLRFSGPGVARLVRMRPGRMPGPAAAAAHAGTHDTHPDTRSHRTWPTPVSTSSRRSSGRRSTTPSTRPPRRSPSVTTSRASAPRSRGPGRRSSWRRTPRTG
ncbi:hypothetical protein SGPA1_12581 [Streptomyces misionensis JCM 4497]